MPVVDYDIRIASMGTLCLTQNADRWKELATNAKANYGCAMRVHGEYTNNARFNENDFYRIDTTLRNFTSKTNFLAFMAKASLRVERRLPLQRENDILRLGRI